ncbi:MAG TPA: ABC transporter ATP-binding protein [Polyangiaceae bacterium]|nr:ABC transporter ATP-binding protein [Polyangiaceae bacterium]
MSRAPAAVAKFNPEIDLSGRAPARRTRHAGPPPLLSAQHMTKRFGSLVALDDVSFTLKPGTFHALLGENGAGKSTLVKCIMGFYHADSGSVTVAESEVTVKSPRDAQRYGIGMVYQHFTLVENMSVAENLVMARAEIPRLIDWKKEQEELSAFMAGMPFRIPVAKLVRQLAAGEKQKLEILKQLYLGSKIVILDEPTSVLTPQEADDVLGLLREMTRRGEISVAIITHKFREVMAFADDVTVLRRGALAGSGNVSEHTPESLAELMVGSEPPSASLERKSHAHDAVGLELEAVCADDDLGLPVLSSVNLKVRAGEILGVAGVSGNGQEELVEVLAGQRDPTAGVLKVAGKPYAPTRQQIRENRVRLLPEAPLRNACVAGMSVAENIGFRCFDEPGFTLGRWAVSKGSLRRKAVKSIREFRIKTPGPEAPIGGLSGGNVQRAVLARELDGDVAVLIAANPCFGLDFAAVAEIRSRIVAARNAGTAVLLVSADLDEIFALSDRIVVMSDGKLVHETSAETANLAEIGRHMAGDH